MTLTYYPNHILVPKINGILSLARVKQRLTNLPVPLKHIRILIKVVDFVSRFTIEQTYKNEKSFPIDTEFAFPVKDNTAITGLSWEIDGNVHEAEIKDCDQAAMLFESAFDQGHMAAILNCDGGRVLTMKIGNLEARSEIKIRLQFVEELAIDRNNHLTLELPRDFERNSFRRHRDVQIEDLCASKSTRGRPPFLSIIAEIMSREDIMSVKSSSHQIHVEQPIKEGELNVVLANFEGNFFDLVEHFVISIHIQGLNLPSIHFEKHLKTNNSFAAMVNFVPSFEFKYEPVELVVLLTSFKPMPRIGFSNLGFFLRLLLHSLPPGSFFKIVPSITYKAKSAPVGTQAILQVLNNWDIHTWNARYGEELFEQCLVEEIKAPVVGSSQSLRKCILVVANSDPELRPQTLDSVRSSAEFLSIFVLKVNPKSDNSSLKVLASLGRGLFEAFSGRNLIDNGKKLISLLNCTLHPVYEAKVCWERRCDLSRSSTFKIPSVMHKHNPILGQWPRRIPRVYNGQRSSVFFMFGSTPPATKKVHVHLSCDRFKSHTRLETRSTAIMPNTKIHQLASHCRIRELELDMTAKNRDELVKVSETFQVMSNATSFYVVSPDEQTEQVSKVLFQKIDQGSRYSRTKLAETDLLPYPPPPPRSSIFIPTPTTYICLEAHDLEDLVVPQLRLLDHLLDFQDDDGGFGPSDKLSTFLLGNPSKLKECKTDNEELKVWATALAVWVLRIRMDRLSELWCLIEDKALKWLQSNHANVDDVLGRAQNAISMNAE